MPEASNPVHQAAHDHYDEKEEEVEEVTGPAQHRGPFYTGRGSTCVASARGCRRGISRVLARPSASRKARILERSSDMNTFKADIEEIRRRAREKMEDGAVTADLRRGPREGHRGPQRGARDRDRVHAPLQEPLLHGAGHPRAVRRGGVPRARHEEQGHADHGGQAHHRARRRPNYNPDGLSTRSHAEYGEGDTLEEMIREDLVAERIAISTYSEIIRWLGNDDPTTRRMIEEILAKEEEHADDLANLLGADGSRPAARSALNASRSRAVYPVAAVRVRALKPVRSGHHQRARG